MYVKMLIYYSGNRKPKFIDASYVKDGAVVIDVGTTEMLKISCVVMWILILLCLKATYHTCTGRCRSYDNCDAHEQFVEAMKR